MSNERPIYDIGTEIWNRKYRYHGSEDIPEDKTKNDTILRVAKAAAAKEKDREFWTGKFTEALSDFKFIPGGRIVANAGTKRTEVTMFNCFVMNRISDSIDGIFETVKESALTQKQGGGVGFDFSTIRPTGSPIKGCEASASGPLSFMQVLDSTCRTIMSAGQRRGAQMGIMRCDHPDIEKFITAKRGNAALQMFNLSVAIVITDVAWLGQGFHYPGYTIYAMASWTFYQLTVAIINLVRLRRSTDPVIRAVKDMRMCVVLVSLFTLQNAMVAVMSYSGYDIEDAVVLNRASIDRGYGRVVISKKQVFSLKKYPNGSSDLIKGPPRREDQKNIDDHTWNRLFEPYKALGSDGIVESGVPIHPGDIMVNKHVPMDTGSFGADRDQLRAAPVKYKESGGYVDKVLITTTDNEYFVIKTMVRDMRRPELGDKFSSRHGQKGVVGLITGQENLPFSTAGIYPDMIMNPHGFPSRMTVGKMMELLAGKAGLWDGERKFGTIFGGTDIEDCAEELIRHGFNYSGKDMFYSGRERDGWVRDRHHRRAATRVYLHRSGVLSAIEAHGEG